MGENYPAQHIYGVFDALVRDDKTDLLESYKQLPESIYLDKKAHLLSEFSIKQCLKQMKLLEQNNANADQTPIPLNEIDDKYDCLYYRQAKINTVTEIIADMAAGFGINEDEFPMIIYNALQVIADIENHNSDNKGIYEKSIQDILGNLISIASQSAENHDYPTLLRICHADRTFSQITNISRRTARKRFGLS